MPLKSGSACRCARRQPLSSRQWTKVTRSDHGCAGKPPTSTCARSIVARTTMSVEAYDWTSSCVNEPDRLLRLNRFRIRSVAPRVALQDEGLAWLFNVIGTAGTAGRKRTRQSTEKALRQRPQRGADRDLRGGALLAPIGPKLFRPGARFGGLRGPKGDKYSWSCGGNGSNVDSIRREKSVQLRSNSAITRRYSRRAVVLRPMIRPFLQTPKIDFPAFD